MRPSALLIGLVLAVVPAAASAAPPTVSVKLTAQGVVLSPMQVQVGEVQFAVVNVGARPNRFGIRGKRTRLLRNGERATLLVSFTMAGAYAQTRFAPPNSCT